MSKTLTRFLCSLVLLGLVTTLSAVERFPPPDFETGYTFPGTTVPGPQLSLQEYIDLAALVVALSLAAYLVLKRRSRFGVNLLTVVCLLYFGFWRKGCICPIGATQNVALTLFDSDYAIPLFALIFFLLPLVFSLFFGRVFCSGVCPLGGIQDLVLMRPMTLPRWLESGLRLGAYLYLGTAVLAAATGSGFLICRYDPFVGFFRMSGNADMITLGICFLIVGLFIGRPYCRFFCPYSVLLRVLSRLAKWRVTITPNLCISCRLCEEVCPYGCITAPTVEWPRSERLRGKPRLVALLALLPILMGLGAGLGFASRPVLARMHATVQLAERVALEESEQVEGTVDETDAFRESGRSVASLYEEASALRAQFGIGGVLLGCFLGLVVGVKLLGASVWRARTDYETDPAGCVSCARCYRFCPKELEQTETIKEMIGAR